MLDLPRPSGTAAWARGQGQEARPSRPSLSPGVPPAPDTGILDPLQGHPHNPEQGKDASETEVRASGKGVGGVFSLEMAVCRCDTRNEGWTVTGSFRELVRVSVAFQETLLSTCYVLSLYRLRESRVPRSLLLFFFF